MTNAAVAWPRGAARHAKYVLPWLAKPDFVASVVSSGAKYRTACTGSMTCHSRRAVVMAGNAGTLLETAAIRPGGELRRVLDRQGLTFERVEVGQG